MQKKIAIMPRVPISKTYSKISTSLKVLSFCAHLLQNAFLKKNYEKKLPFFNLFQISNMLHNFTFWQPFAKNALEQLLKFAKYFSLKYERIADL